MLEIILLILTCHIYTDDITYYMYDDVILFLHANSGRLPTAFFIHQIHVIHSLKWHSAPNIISGKHTQPYKFDAKLTRKNVKILKRGLISLVLLKIWNKKKIYFFFLGKYQKYLISCSCVENISIFHSCFIHLKMLMFSTHAMKYIWYSPQKSNYPLCTPEITSK